MQKEAAADTVVLVLIPVAAIRIAAVLTIPRAHQCVRTEASLERRPGMALGLRTVRIARLPSARTTPERVMDLVGATGMGEFSGAPLRRMHSNDSIRVLQPADAVERVPDT